MRLEYGTTCANERFLSYYIYCHPHELRLNVGLLSRIPQFDSSTVSCIAVDINPPKQHE